MKILKHTHFSGMKDTIQIFNFRIDPAVLSNYSRANIGRNKKAESAESGFVLSFKPH